MIGQKLSSSIVFSVLNYKDYKDLQKPNLRSSAVIGDGGEVGVTLVLVSELNYPPCMYLTI